MPVALSRGWQASCVDAAIGELMTDCAKDMGCQPPEWAQKVFCEASGVGLTVSKTYWVATGFRVVLDGKGGPIMTTGAAHWEEVKKQRLLK